MVTLTHGLSENCDVDVSRSNYMQQTARVEEPQLPDNRMD